MKSEPCIDNMRVSAYRIPTDLPESDGTMSWNSTGLILVEIDAGGVTGIGYTYGHPSIAELIKDHFTHLLLEQNAMDIATVYWSLMASTRNLGRPGMGSMAISAVDIALWDLKARLLDIPLAKFIGQVRSQVPLYASGGFTSYSTDQLESQLAGWAEQGFHAIKIKIARYPEQDRARLQTARNAIGSDISLFVDANGAYTIKQALSWADTLNEFDVSWFEEPVSSDNLEGLRLLRDRCPAGIEISAGEYGYDLPYFQRMLVAGAVDVLQADATRCGGISGFLAASALCEAYQISLSSHTAPAIHLHTACSLHNLRHVEWFYDHVRIERILFDGSPTPKQGMLEPDLSRPGHGLTFKHKDAAQYAV